MFTNPGQLYTEYLNQHLPYCRSRDPMGDIQREREEDRKENSKGEQEQENQCKNSDSI